MAVVWQWQRIYARVLMHSYRGVDLKMLLCKSLIRLYDPMYREVYGLNCLRFQKKNLSL